MYLVGDERWGGCETCGDTIAVDGRTPPLTRWYRPVRRDGQSVTLLVRLCADCSDIIRHGAHEEWESVIIVGHLVGRTVTFRRPAGVLLGDYTHESGIVIRELLERHMVVIASPHDGVFAGFERFIHRSNVTLVWPLVSTAVSV